MIPLSVFFFFKVHPPPSPWNLIPPPLDNDHFLSNTKQDIPQQHKVADEVTKNQEFEQITTSQITSHCIFVQVSNQLDPVAGHIQNLEPAELVDGKRELIEQCHV